MSQEVELSDLRIEREPSKRRTRKRRPAWIKWVALLAVLLGLAVVFRSAISAKLERMSWPTVDVLRIGAKSPGSVAAATGTSANGYIVARTRAALSADTPGRIVAMNVQEGSVVKQGDVVAQIFADEYAAALRRAEADVLVAQRSEVRARAEIEAARTELDTLRANVDAARADLAQAQANLDLAELSIGRAQKLLDEKVGTADARDRAARDVAEAQASVQGFRARIVSAEKALLAGEARLKVAESSVPEAEARTQSALASKDLAQATLDKTSVRAPFDGIVVLKDAEVGEVVSPNSQGGSSARGSVVTMVDFATLEVQAEVPETSLATVTLGAEARIYLDAYPETAYAGRVDRIWPTANRTKATVEVRVTFTQRDDRLRPEMGARVVFGGSGAAPIEARIVVPTTAVRRVDGVAHVFVVETSAAGDRVRRRDVTLGTERAGRVAIVDGLKDGDEVVTKLVPEIVDGASINAERAEVAANE